MGHNSQNTQIKRSVWKATLEPKVKGRMSITTDLEAWVRTLLFHEFERQLDRRQESETILENQAGVTAARVISASLMKTKKITIHTKAKTAFPATVATIFSKQLKISADEKVKIFEIEMSRDLEA